MPPECRIIRIRRWPEACHRLRFPPVPPLHLARVCPLSRACCEPSAIEQPMRRFDSSKRSFSTTSKDDSIFAWERKIKYVRNQWDCLSHLAVPYSLSTMDGLIGDSRWKSPARGATVKAQRLEHFPCGCSVAPLHLWAFSAIPSNRENALSSIKGCGLVNSTAITRAEKEFGVTHRLVHPSLLSQRFGSPQGLLQLNSACWSAGQNRNMGSWQLMGAIYDGKN